MDTPNSEQILIEEMEKYAGKGLNAESYLTVNQVEHVYSIVDIANVQGKRIIATVLLVRVQDQKIVIELDHNNKPLIDALIARGVPEAEIVAAYRDSTILA